MGAQCCKVGGEGEPAELMIDARHPADDVLPAAPSPSCPASETLPISDIAHPTSTANPHGMPRNAMQLLAGSNCGGLVLDVLPLADLASLAATHPLLFAKIAALEERWMYGCVELCGANVNWLDDGDLDDTSGWMETWHTLAALRTEYLTRMVPDLNAGLRLPETLPWGGEEWTRLTHLPWEAEMRDAFARCALNHPSITQGLLDPQCDTYPVGVAFYRRTPQTAEGPLGPVEAYSDAIAGLRTAIRPNSCNDAICPEAMVLGPISVAALLANLPSPVKVGERDLFRDFGSPRVARAIWDAAMSCEPFVALCVGEEPQEIQVPSGSQPIHYGFMCDKSGMDPIVGPRFHLTGQNYDLCEEEYRELDAVEQAVYERIDVPVEPVRFRALTPAQAIDVLHRTCQVIVKDKLGDTASDNDWEVPVADVGAYYDEDEPDFDAGDEDSTISTLGIDQVERELKRQLAAVADEHGLTHAGLLAAAAADKPLGLRWDQRLLDQLDEAGEPRVDHAARAELEASKEELAGLIRSQLMAVHGGGAHADATVHPVMLTDSDCLRDYWSDAPRFDNDHEGLQAFAFISEDWALVLAATCASC